MYHPDVILCITVSIYPFVQKRFILQAAYRRQVPSHGEIHDKALRTLRSAGWSLSAASRRTHVSMEHVLSARQQRTRCAGNAQGRRIKTRLFLLNKYI